MPSPIWLVLEWLTALWGEQSAMWTGIDSSSCPLALKSISSESIGSISEPMDFQCPETVLACSNPALARGRVLVDLPGLKVSPHLSGTGFDTDYQPASRAQGRIG
ncbi:MAG: hypothetical protein LPH21_13460 [Shewanella sp.]|nr:hypothetical protein [Shewanella sp.]